MANNLADNDWSDRVYGFRNNAAMCACRNVDELMCCFDVWFVAQFLRDKCTDVDFGLPRFTDNRENAGLLHARMQIRNFGLSLAVTPSDDQRPVFRDLYLHLYRTFYTSLLIARDYANFENERVCAFVCRYLISINNFGKFCPSIWIITRNLMCSVVNDTLRSVSWKSS